MHSAQNASQNAMTCTGHGCGQNHYIEVAYTANVQTIDSMEFDHVPNPGVISPQFLGYLNNKLKEKIRYIFLGQRSLNLWSMSIKTWVEL